MEDIFNKEIVNPEQSEIIDGFIKLLFSGVKPTEILNYVNEHEISFMEYASMLAMRESMENIHEQFKKLVAANQKLRDEQAAILRPLAGTMMVMKPLIADLAEQSENEEGQKLSGLGLFLMTGSKFIPQAKEIPKEELKATILKVQNLLPYIMGNMDAIVHNLSNIDWLPAINVLIDRKVVPKNLFSEKELKGLPSGSTNTETDGSEG